MIAFIKIFVGVFILIFLTRNTCSSSCNSFLCKCYKDAQLQHALGLKLIHSTKQRGYHQCIYELNDIKFVTTRFLYFFKKVALIYHDHEYSYNRLDVSIKKKYFKIYLISKYFNWKKYENFNVIYKSIKETIEGYVI